MATHDDSLIHFRKVLSPIPVCGQCDAQLRQPHPFYCLACKVVFYCGKDHQVAHRAAHKRCCQKIKKAKEKMMAEERIIRSWDGTEFGRPARMFEEQEGHFWGILDTRDYMRARADMIYWFKNDEIGTYAGVYEALRNMLEMMILCESDNLGQRTEAPGLMIRLGLDQAAYEFMLYRDMSINEPEEFAAQVKSDTVRTELLRYGGRSHSVFAGLHEKLDLFKCPVVDIVASPTPPRIFGKWFDLAWRSCIALIKYRLQICLEHRHGMGTMDRAGSLPYQSLEMCCGQILENTAVGNSKLLAAWSDPVKAKALLHRIRADFVNIYDATQEHNEHYWPLMLHPEANLNDLPAYMSHGDISEAKSTLSITYQAWLETCRSTTHLAQLAAS